MNLTFRFTSEKFSYTPDHMTYCYIPVSNQSNAPFLHAYQDGANDGKCGFYALNTYLDTPLSFPSFIDALTDYLVQHRGIATKEEALLYIHPYSKEGSNLNFLDLNDVDIEMLQGALSIISSKYHETSSHFVKSTLVAFDLAEKKWTDISKDLLPKFHLIDRFILGIASPVENHLTCWRKDQDGNWWKIDSLLKEQIGFDHPHKVVDEIQNSYGSYFQGTLLLLMPLIVMDHLELSESEKLKDFSRKV